MTAVTIDASRRAAAPPRGDRPGLDRSTRSSSPRATPTSCSSCVVGVALLRGPVFGACAGFWAGLVLDTATLGTLGLTSLLLTLAGYWAGASGR